MSRLALCITIIAAPLRRKTLIEPGTIPRYSPSKPVARACASQFLPACAWFLRFSNLRGIKFQAPHAIEVMLPPSNLLDSVT